MAADPPEGVGGTLGSPVPFGLATAGADDESGVQVELAAPPWSWINRSDSDIASPSSADAACAEDGEPICCDSFFFFSFGGIFAIAVHYKAL
jgi:hypothetical protein